MNYFFLVLDVFICFVLDSVGAKRWNEVETSKSVEIFFLERKFRVGSNLNPYVTKTVNCHFDRSSA
jgi:hypothetical protein